MIMKSKPNASADAAPVPKSCKLASSTDEAASLQPASLSLQLQTKEHSSEVMSQTFCEVGTFHSEGRWFDVGPLSIS